MYLQVKLIHDKHWWWIGIGPMGLQLYASRRDAWPMNDDQATLVAAMLQGVVDTRFVVRL